MLYKWAPSSENVSLRVCDQLRFKPACSASEASYRLDISDLETRNIILSKERTTKALIRLRGCAGWSVPLLFAYDDTFLHDLAQMSHSKTKTTKWPVRPAKTQISLGIHPVWSVFAMPAWVAKEPRFLHGNSKDWSDYAQADLSLRWVHKSFCWLCHAATQMSQLTGKRTVASHDSWSLKHTCAGPEWS